MNKTLIALALAASVTACENKQSAPTQQSATPAEAVESSHSSSEQVNIAFDKFKQQLIDDMWKLYPGYAVYVGYYKYDDQLPIPNDATRAKDKAFIDAKLAELQSFDLENLSANNAGDFHILKNQLQSSVWNDEVFKSYQWNPSSYNVAGVFGVILNTDYKSMDERLQSIKRRMVNIPAYYEAAKTNITTPTLVHTKLAIKQNTGALGMFEKSIPAAVDKSTLSEADKTEALANASASAVAIRSFISWLEAKQTELEASGNARDFRIGEELYNQKFELDIFSGYSAKELYQKALADKTRVHGEIAKITTQLWPTYFPDTAIPQDPLLATKQLIDHISVKHVERDKFVDSIREQIPELEAFVAKHNLIEMDADKPLVVRETPEYQRGFAGASINAPGPYDAGANTYYNVTPLDHYDDEQAESYLREYNHWLLQILNIHEAVPGHYTQLVHSNKSPSLVKSIFGNGAMIEGWAVYTERMMLEEGYGDNEPELWLMYYKWNLRVIANAIIDYSIHVNGMTQEQAMDLMMNEAFQEQAEAEGKWNRAMLSQVQLASYFTGYSEIYALREELKEATGEGFSLVDFHNQFLSYGSAPVPIIKQMMTDDYIRNH